MENLPLFPEHFPLHFPPFWPENIKNYDYFEFSIFSRRPLVHFHSHFSSDSYPWKWKSIKNKKIWRTSQEYAMNMVHNPAVTAENPFRFVRFEYGVFPDAIHSFKDLGWDEWWWGHWLEMNCGSQLYAWFDAVPSINPWEIPGGDAKGLQQLHILP